MNNDKYLTEKSYEMKFDIGTIKHLGLQMYSTLPPVIGELVANAWDANATKVEITIPKNKIDEQTSEIIISDNGFGMSDGDVRTKYLIVGRDRREKEQSEKTPPPHNRKIMGRKGIGKFSAFGIAKEIVIESVKDGEVSHFRMNYDELLKKAEDRIIKLPRLPSTGNITEGTKITLRYIRKYKTRPIQIGKLRQGLARRFAVIGAIHNFEVVINGSLITPEERDLKRLLAKDMNNELYLWEYDEEKIEEGTELTVSGWIGALSRTSPNIDETDRGIVLMARGKLVQEPFVFNTVVGQQFALSYLVGELHAEFVDEEEDMIGTTRNSLVWDTDENDALMKWGKKEVNKIASSWAKKRSEDNKRKLQKNPTYLEFQEQAEKIDKKREFKQADRLVQQLILRSIDKNPNSEIKDFEPMIQMFLDFWRFDTFRELAEDIKKTGIDQPEKLINLFREWEILEAIEMLKVTDGRITTIETLQRFIENNALEKPTLHNFLKKFPWIIDQRWTLVADEVTYSKLLRENFPEDRNVPDENRRIDFLCVGEGQNLAVVEIKRPQSRISKKELDQIEDYVNFMEARIQGTSDPNYGYKEVIGYLLCGDVVDKDEVKIKIRRLAQTKIYVRQYRNLLDAVKGSHAEFLERYNELQKAKAENRSDS